VIFNHELTRMDTNKILLKQEVFEIVGCALEVLNGLGCGDTKTVDHITDIDRAKMINYLNLTGLRVGLILNFEKPKLEWERIVV